MTAWRTFIPFSRLMLALMPLTGNLMATASPNAQSSVAALGAATHLGQLSVDTELLANTEQWHKILFYAPTWMLRKKSLVDDPRFFLSEHGKSNAEEELKATLRAFNEGSPSERQEALCKYPARRLWLEQKLKRAFEDPQPKNSSDVCQRFNIFKKSVQANKASLIFSSYYPGNPGSLFGHTLLKFAKVNEAGTSGNELLDFGLNHAAQPTTSNPLLYAPMGLSGLFPGFISFMPYYVKVQEYNNAESRDLWEYELDLNTEEVRLALLAVFELSTHRVDYFYFDDNCSLIMLAFIDIARPSLQLVEKFNAWVIPGDTVRVVHNKPGLVAQVKFRASNVRRFLQLEERLTDEERRIFNSLIESKKNANFDLQSLNKLTPEQKMHVIDTILEYIDADEQLTGTKEPVKWVKERPEILKFRAQLGLTSAPLKIPKPEQEAPHKAYPPTRFSLGSITALSANLSPKNGILLGWRPALHTLDNPVAGMGADLGIAFFNLEYLVHRKKIWLREFTPLGIETIPVDRPQFSAVSWGFSAGYKQRCFAGCGQTSVAGELGRAWKLTSEDSRAALRAGMRLGNDASGGLFIEPGLSGLVNIPFANDKRWSTRIAMSRTQSLKKLPYWNREAQTSFVIRPVLPVEIDFSTAFINKDLILSARASWYF
ncbi:DUF4105 domain-containing protein [bacterium]|nr:DUF4105 domain-containing protein [bacterium]